MFRSWQSQSCTTALVLVAVLVLMGQFRPELAVVFGLLVVPLYMIFTVQFWLKHGIEHFVAFWQSEHSPSLDDEEEELDASQLEARNRDERLAAAALKIITFGVFFMPLLGLYWGLQPLLWWINGEAVDWTEPTLVPRYGAVLGSLTLIVYLIAQQITRTRGIG